MSGIYFNDIKEIDSFRQVYLAGQNGYSCILFLSSLGKLLVGRNHAINVFSVKNRLVEQVSSINVSGLVQSIAHVRASEVLIGLDTGQLVLYDLAQDAKLSSWHLKEPSILLLTLEKCGHRTFTMGSLSGLSEVQLRGKRLKERPRMYRDKAVRQTYKVAEGRAIVKLGCGQLVEIDCKRKSILARLPADIEIEAVKTKDRQRNLFLTRDQKDLKLLNLSNLEFLPIAEMTKPVNVKKSFYHNFNEDSLQLCVLKHSIPEDSLKFNVLNYSL